MTTTSVQPKPEDLYDYVRLEDMDAYNKAAGLERIKVISADGPSDYTASGAECDG